MKKFGRGGSTFATVVAAAVVIAVASTGGAVAGGLITSKQIKNNTIKSIDVRDGNLKGVDIADNSLTGADVADNSLTGADVNEGTLGTVPSASKATNVVRAAVNADGTLVAGQSDGAVSSATTVDGAGTYEVVFNRVVTGCTFVVASGEAGTTGGQSEAIVNETGRGGNTSGIYVTTRNDAGTLVSRPFMVIGVC